MNGYCALARCYDRLMEFDYAALCDYYESVFAEFGVKPNTLLDLACGTGSVSAELFRRGYDVTSVDASTDMLMQASAKLGSIPNALLLCQDMRKLDLNDTVDSAVCALDSINHLPDRKSLLQTFERVRLFLNPGGLFIFDVHSREKFFSVLADQVFVYDLPDLFCCWQSKLIDRHLRYTLDFFIGGAAGCRRYTDAFCEYWYGPDTLTKLLRQVGLEPLLIDTQHDPERVFITARKTVI